MATQSQLNSTVHPSPAVSEISLVFSNGDSPLVSATDKEALILLLECSACLKLPRLPIFICDGGHSICSQCCQKLETCPQCNGSLTKTRNLLAEALLERFTVVKCPYSKEGCPKVTCFRELPAHVPICAFR